MLDGLCKLGRSCDKWEQDQGLYRSTLRKSSPQVSRQHVSALLSLQQFFRTKVGLFHVCHPIRTGEYISDSRQLPQGTRHFNGVSM